MSDCVLSKLNEGLENGCYPSAVAATGFCGEILAMEAVGRILLPDGAKANLDTRYDMASMSKILSPTMLALQGIEDGTLTLYDTVGMYLDAPEDKRGITVFQLMTHTAGFIPSFRLDQVCKDKTEALGAIMSRPLQSPPGTNMAYSCMGYITLGKMLEARYGKPLNALASERVFEPLTMRNTGYNPVGENIAATEIDPETGRAVVGVVHDENARFLGGVSANAGVFSNIFDMCLFASMLAKGGDGFLTKAMLKKAIRNYTPGFDAHRGLGFHLAGTPENFMGDLFPAESFGHTGFTGTSMAIDPNTGFWAVLLTNRVHPTRENAKLFRFRRAFHNAIYAAYEILQ